MGAGTDNEPLASPENFFPVRKRSVAELFAELLGRSFLAFPHFATVDYHIMRVAFSLDLDLAKFHESCLHVSMFRWLKIQLLQQDVPQFRRLEAQAGAGFEARQVPCVFCGSRATQVHHKQYARRNIGREPIERPVSVCKL